MKFFHWASAVTAVFSVFASSGAQTAPAALVISNINSLTTMSSNLNVVVTNLNIITVIFQGYQVAQGLTGISTAASQIIIQASANSGVTFDDSDAGFIVEALTTFVEVHQQLLSTIIGKHGLLALFFFTEPIRGALVLIERTVDQLAFLLIGMIPTQAPAATQQINSLDVTLGQAVIVYSN